jgi:hypothetical protein
MTSEPKELELTPDLLEYAKAVALKEAPPAWKSASTRLRMRPAACRRSRIGPASGVYRYRSTRDAAAVVVVV